MEGELLTLQGSVTGTGVISLLSDLFYSAVDYIRIPKGLKAKAWTKRIGGEACDITIEYTHDVTADNPTWNVLSKEKLASPGELALEKRKPLLARGFKGVEAIRVNRVSGSGDSYIDLEVELGE